MATPGPVITRVAEGTAEHPRNGGAVLLDRKDGSFLLFHMMAYSSDLQLVAGDDAPHDIVRLESFDGGDTWQNQQMVIAREPGETATYSPTFCRLKNGKLMFRYERLHHFVKDEPWRLSSYAVITAPPWRLPGRHSPAFDGAYYYSHLLHGGRCAARRRRGSGPE